MDMTKPVQVQQSFFKSQVSQDGRLLSDEELMSALDLLPDAESDLETVEPAWNVGYGLTLMSPILLIHGLILASSDWKRGEGSVLVGTAGLGTGIYLLNWSVRLRAQAAEAYNQSLGETPVTPPLHLRFDLVGLNSQTPGLLLRAEFE